MDRYKNSYIDRLIKKIIDTLVDRQMETNVVAMYNTLYVQSVFVFTRIDKGKE